MLAKHGLKSEDMQKWYVCPSVMELLDVIPKEINGEYFRV